MASSNEEALQMHELYNSLVRAGFRDKQALYLVAMIVNDMNEQAVIIHHVDEDDDEDDSDPGSAD